jgi:hypothetical protein
MLSVNGSVAQGKLQISATDVTNLMASPPGWYAEVETAAYPKGEERAQISLSP